MSLEKTITPTGFKIEGEVSGVPGSVEYTHPKDVSLFGGFLPTTLVTIGNKKPLRAYGGFTGDENTFVPTTREDLALMDYIGRFVRENTIDSPFGQKSFIQNKIIPKPLYELESKPKLGLPTPLNDAEKMALVAMVNGLGGVDTYLEFVASLPPVELDLGSLLGKLRLNEDHTLPEFLSLDTLGDDDRLGKRLFTERPYDPFDKYGKL